MKMRRYMYKHLDSCHIFTPVVIETTGVFGPRTIERVAIQRGNAASVLGTMKVDSEYGIEEFFHLCYSTGRSPTLAHYPRRTTADSLNTEIRGDNLIEESFSEVMQLSNGSINFRATTPATVCSWFFIYM